MAILVDSETRVLVLGISGRMARVVTRDLIAYGTQVVGGVVPGRGGTTQDGVPIFDFTDEAVSATGANAVLGFVPAQTAREATIEALGAGVPLVVYPGDGLPVHDAARMRRAAEIGESVLVGPNTPGLIAPGIAKLGFMPSHCFVPGPLGVISKSGSLSYESCWRLTSAGIGQSTVVGVGGDPIKGMTMGEALARFHGDPQTEGVLVLGEVGGTEEYQIVDYMGRDDAKPVVALIVGRTAPRGRKLGHAGALVTGEADTYSAKVSALQSAGVLVAGRLGELVATVRTALGGYVLAK